MPRIVPQDAILVPPQAKRVFKGVIYDVYQWEQELYDGSTATFERLRRPDTMLGLCVKDDRIVFIKDEQPGRPASVRLPGGRVEPSEDWDDAVKRECLEEVGLRFTNWRLIDVQQPVSKIEWFIAIYLATDFEAAVETKHDAGERIEIISLSFDEAKELLTAKADFLNGSARDLFARVSSLEELLQLPTFTGRTL